jgi:broad specificity phosphatase PhoE
MRHFLVVYNRREGRILRSGQYEGAADALEARFAAEREFQRQPDIEVVVLGGESWQSIERTHSRYFRRVQDLAKAGLARLAVTSP